MDTALTRISAAFSFLSPLVVVATIAVMIAGGLGGPAAIDFASPDVLRHLKDSRPAILWSEALSLVGPIVALGAGLGWYRILKPAGSYVALGVLLWYAGMIFVITQDALEFTLVARLPDAYFASDASSQAAIAALGSTLGSFIDVLTLVGDLVSYFGILLVSIAMLSGVQRVPRWLGILGLLAGVLIAIGLVAGAISPNAGPIGAARPLGFLLFMAWFVGTGVVMARWRPPAVAAA